MERELSLSEPDLGMEEAEALREIIDSGWITMGQTVQRFEDEFARVHGASHAVAVSSGTAGLHLSLAGLDIGAGHEVLVPSLTFVATANAVRYTGATPVLVDIESIVRPHMDLEDARDKLTHRTRAVVVVHYGGWSCRMEAWRRFAAEKGLFLVEDAAHISGLPGYRPVGDAAVFSFYGNKNMTTAEGGMILARESELAARMRRLRSHGMTTQTLDRHFGHAFSYDVTDLGFNYRMDELRAALGLVQLDKLPGGNRHRSRLLNHYRNRVEQADMDLQMPFSDECPTSGHLCPVLLPGGTDRGKLMRAMRDHRIHTSIHYPPVHLFTHYRSRVSHSGLAVTEEYSARELSLPLHPGLTTQDVDYVVDRLLECQQTTTAVEA